MKAGVAKAEITPPIGAPLSGYRARSGVSNGIHDPLYSRAVAIEGPEDAVVLISVDVLALSASFVSEIRRHISEVTAVPYSHIVIAATHTHSGPHTIQTFFNADVPLDAGYMSFLSMAIVHSGVDAWQMRKEARIGTGSCDVTAIGVNRRDPQQGKVDRRAGIIRIDQTDGSPMAAIVIYGCHPTVLGVNNLLITGDFPSATIALLEKRMGPDAFALFFNGAEGDVSIGRSSERSAIGVQSEDRTFQRAQELGEGLAQAVLQALPEINTSASTKVRVANMTGYLHGRKFPKIEMLEKAILAARKRSQEAGCNLKDETIAPILIEEVYAEARYNNARILKMLNDKVPIELTAILIGQQLFISVPAEVFAETGLSIKSHIYGHTSIIGLANGYIGYLPTSSAFPHGGYEVEVSICDIHSEQHLISMVRRLTALLIPEVAEGGR